MRIGAVIKDFTLEFLAELVAVVVVALVMAAGITAFDRAPVVTGVVFTVVAGFAIYGGVTVVGRLRHRGAGRDPVSAAQQRGIGALIAVALWLNYELLT